MEKRMKRSRVFKSKQEWCREIFGSMAGKRLEDGEFLSDVRVSELVGEDGGRPEIRDAVVKHSTFSDSWEEVLPVIFAKDNTQDVVVVDPDDYIRMASGIAPYPEGKLVLVSGDVQVPSWSHQTERTLNFPQAVIRGSLEIFNTECLREIDCVVTGWLSLTNCQGVNSVRGEVFGSVSLNKVGLSKLGADFRCAGNLIAFDCPDLSLLNCESLGGVSVSKSGLVQTGPAFFSGGTVNLSECHELRKLSGVVLGNVKVEGLPPQSPKGLPFDFQGLRCEGEIVVAGKTMVEGVKTNVQGGTVKGDAGALARGGKMPKSGTTRVTEKIRDDAQGR